VGSRPTCARATPRRPPLAAGRGTLPAVNLRKPAWLKQAEDRLRPLDRLPKRVALATGGAVGLGAGALAGWTGEAWAVAVGAGALGVAGWLAASGEAVAVLGEEERTLSDALGMKDLPGGMFWMGSAENEQDAFPDEHPRHQQPVAPLAMAAYVVRQSLYQAVMGVNPSDPKGDDLPANHVSWFDAVRFCNALSAKEALRPAYGIGEGEEPAVEWDLAADGFRIPTEAEWEYAARAGTTSAYSFGDDQALLGEYAWWSRNAEEPRRVGTKKPNPWGLFDVHGNVYEWCWDHYSPYSRPSLSTDDRVLRGGSFRRAYPNRLRSADRKWRPPGVRDRDIGFRCARGGSRQP
jgi:formylglycine-generating enzyme required for sulfatase activity